MVLLDTKKLQQQSGVVAPRRAADAEAEVDPRIKEMPKFRERPDKYTGKCFVVKDNIDTDQIIPAEYLTLVPSKVSFTPDATCARRGVVANCCCVLLLLYMCRRWCCMGLPLSYGRFCGTRVCRNTYTAACWYSRRLLTLRPVDHMGGGRPPLYVVHVHCLAAQISLQKNTTAGVCAIGGWMALMYSRSMGPEQKDAACPIAEFSHVDREARLFVCIREHQPRQTPQEHPPIAVRKLPAWNGPFWQPPTRS